VATAMERGLYLGWLAEQDGQVIGGVGLMFLEWGPTRHDSHPWRARIVNMFTAPAVRRQGCARALLQKAMQEAHRCGIGTLSLATSESARGLYAQAGFAQYPDEMLKR